MCMPAHAPAALEGLRSVPKGSWVDMLSRASGLAPEDEGKCNNLLYK